MSLAQISLIVAILAVVLSAGALIYLGRLRRRVATITPDTQALARRLKGRSMPEAFNEILAHLQTFSERMNRLETEAAQLHHSYTATVQQVGLVRFNIDENIRGDLSFALALLDAKESGVILTSLYNLEGCRVFVRAIQQGHSEHDLLPEEELALARARGLADEQS